MYTFGLPMQRASACGLGSNKCEKKEKPGGARKKEEPGGGLGFNTCNIRRNQKEPGRARTQEDTGRPRRTHGSQEEPGKKPGGSQEEPGARRGQEEAMSYSWLLLSPPGSSHGSSWHFGEGLELFWKSQKEPRREAPE